MIKTIFSIEKIVKAAFSFIETPERDFLEYNRVILMPLISAFFNEISKYMDVGLVKGWKLQYAWTFRIISY